MSIKEKLQQLQVGRARQEAERVKREQEARELESARLVAAEAKESAEKKRAKRILDSKGIIRLVDEELLPVLHEIGVGASAEICKAEILVRRERITGNITTGWRTGKEYEHVEAVGVVVSGYVGENRAKLGFFLETGDSSNLSICSGKHNDRIAQIPLSDWGLIDKAESLIAEIISDREKFVWSDYSEPAKKGADRFP